MGVKTELIEEIITSANENSALIGTYIENIKIETKSFSDLEWRIDIKTATKSARKIIEPEIILKLNLTGDNQQKETHLLQTDIVNLVHLTNSLDEALNEIKSNYCRRIFKNLV